MKDSEKTKMWRRISRDAIPVNSIPSCKVFKDKKKEASKNECRNFKH